MDKILQRARCGDEPFLRVDRSSLSWHESLPWRGGWIGVKCGFAHNHKFLEYMSLISASVQTSGAMERRGSETIDLMEHNSFYTLNTQAYDS